jgi:peroxiredoxin Q/BCP
MLEIGSPAPLFSLPDQNGTVVNLTDFKGKYVVLYFYPKAMTPGCTTETCNFGETLPDFSALDAVILGASRDSVARQKKFAEKYNISFPLLSDEEGTLTEAYGVWQKKKLYGREFMGIVRSTYLIDPQGKIARVYPKVKVKEHHLEVLEDLKQL